MKKRDIGFWAPPGLNPLPGVKIFALGMIFSGLYSLGFVFRFFRAQKNLLQFPNEPFVYMPDFYTFLGKYWLGFGVLCLFLLGIIVYNYAYHRQGSKSIYLMRRLPSRMELHRRCLALPLFGIFICLICVILLLFVFYWIYMQKTPAEVLAPDQWQKLWRYIL